MRPHSIRTSKTLVADTSRQDFVDPSSLRRYARSRADIECLPRGLSLYSEMRTAPNDLIHPLI